MSALMASVEEVASKPSVAIADAHLLVAEGLAQALSSTYNVTTIAKSGQELERAILANPPDAVVTEFHLLGQSGLETLEHARANHCNAPFVFFTALSEPLTLQRAFCAGARGIIAKHEGVDALRDAIELALTGKAYLSTAFMPALTYEKPRELRLTARQNAVLQLLDQGLTAQQIAERTFLSRRTIESHKSRLLTMTHTHSLIELLVEARRLGLLQQSRKRC